MKRKYLLPLPKSHVGPERPDIFRRTYWLALSTWRRWKQHRETEKWRRTNNPTGQSRPVFVVGCQRSGTTMAVHNLNRSWEIQLYNEHMESQAFHHYELRDLKNVRDLVKCSYARVVLFKALADTFRASLLLDTFPKARILFFSRHFDDVVNSMVRRFKDDAIYHVNRWIEDDFSEFRPFLPGLETQELIRDLYHAGLSAESASALFWLLRNRFYVDLDLSHDARVKLVQYESLVQAPEKSFREICDFIEIDYQPTMIEDVCASSIGRDTPPPIDPAIRTVCDRLWATLCGEKATTPVTIHLHQNLDGKPSY